MRYDVHLAPRIYHVVYCLYLYFNLFLKNNVYIFIYFQSHQIQSHGRNESPIERKMHKYKKQKEKFQIIYPKAVNPSEISEYLAVENAAKSLTVQPPCCLCKGTNLPPIWNNALWEGNKSASCNNTNIINDDTTYLKCNCSICRLDSNVDPDGEYVTLLQDYIGQYNEAYQWYNKPQTPQKECSDPNRLDTDPLMLNDRKGTLV